MRSKLIPLALLALVAFAQPAVAEAPPERPAVLVEGCALGDLSDHMCTVDAPLPA